MDCTLVARLDMAAMQATEISAMIKQYSTRVAPSSFVSIESKFLNMGVLLKKVMRATLACCRIRSLPYKRKVLYVAIEVRELRYRRATLVLITYHDPGACCHSGKCELTVVAYFVDVLTRSISAQPLLLLLKVGGGYRRLSDSGFTKTERFHST